MPRVASESQSIPPSRPIRSQQDVSAKSSASPFSEMLDSAGAPAEPSAVPAGQKVRTERTGRTEKPKPTEAKSADQHSADPTSTDPKDAAAPTGGKATATAGDGEAADDAKANATTNANTSTPPSVDATAITLTTITFGLNTGLGTTTGTDAEAKAKAKADKAAATADTSEGNPEATDQAATSDAAPTDGPAPTPPVPQQTATPAAVAVAPTPALPATDTGTNAPSSGDAPILAIAGQAPRSMPAPTLKPATPQSKPQSQASDAARGDAATDTASPAGPTAAPAKGDATTGAGPQDKDDKATGELHRATADRIAKPATDVPATNQSDAAGTTKLSADPGSNSGLLPPTQGPDAPNSSASAPAPAHASTPAAAVPLAGLAVEIATQAHAGKNHFEIRLDPPELGRIDVKLDVDRDGNVSTRLVVDRSDTLDLLKRDASSLERALQQAGLKTSDQGLDFSLRQHAFAERDASAQTNSRVIVPDDDTAPLEALRQGYGRRFGLGGGLDIRV